MPQWTRRDFLAASAVGAVTIDGGEAETKKTTSPFLEGNYAPIRKETTAGGLVVVGKLPAELDGMYVRNGPNPQFPPIGPYHWFDGDAMLHGVTIRDGKATYRSRYVRTEGFEEEKKAGKALYEGFMGLPDLKKMAAGKEGFKNTANTALVWYNGRLLALWEGGPPHAVEVPSLGTIGRFTFGGKLKHPCTAHPKIDPKTGEFVFFGYQPVKPYLQYSVADTKGVIVRTTPIDVPRPVMMHDFAITARHTVFLDLPVVFSFTGLFRGKMPFGYEPKHGARIGVLPRHGKGSEVKWFDVPPCYVFHTLNAYDSGDEVVLLACRMKAFPEEITPPDEYSDKQMKGIGSKLHRWRLNLKTGKVIEGAVDDLAADFPRIDDALMGRENRFGYLMALKMDALVKYDLTKNTRQRHELGKGRLGGEGVFVPKRASKGEDDGWLVTYVYDRTSRKSELIVVEARDFAAKPVARVLLPERVPFGFHGTWVQGSQLRGLGRETDRRQP